MATPDEAWITFWKSPAGDPPFSSVRFALPALLNGHEVEEIYFLGCNTCDDTGRTFARRVFRPSFEDRMWAVSLSITSSDHLTSSALCFVLSDTLLYQEFQNHQKDGAEVEVPWESWGPKISRIYEGSFHNLLSVTGSTVLCVEDGKAEMHDFNRFTVRRACSGIPIRFGGQYHDAATTIAHGAFQRPLVSSLPFIKYRTSFSVPETARLCLLDNALVLAHDVSCCTSYSSASLID